MLKLVAISDTHNRHNKLVIPKCDVLIHCGDWTSMGYKHEVENFAKWLDEQDAYHIVLIPGNHEKLFEKELFSNPSSRSWILDHCPRANLLIEEEIYIEGIKFYGSPITPFFYDWAWNRHRGQDIQNHWNKIPLDTDILITHGPPHGVLDTSSYPDGSPRFENLGCYQLAQKINEVKPDLHFFGHIHTPGGTQKHIDGVSYFNAAICDEQYAPNNPITEVDYEK